MSCGPPPRPTPPKRSAPDSFIASPSQRSMNASPASSTVIVALAGRRADKWASADVNDTTKWYSGKPVNDRWLACNTTLRTMAPAVHELDKRNKEDKEMMKYYNKTWGNASASWVFTCQPEDFVQGVHARLTAENASDIERFTFSITGNGLEPPETFDSLESFVAAIKQLPVPVAEEEPQPAELQSMREELQQLREDVKNLQLRVTQLEEYDRRREIARRE